MGFSFVRMGAAAAAMLLAVPGAAQAQDTTPRWLFGYWTDHANSCGNLIEFRRDGTFFIEDTGATGRWQVRGDQLTFSAQSTVTARLERLSRDAIRLHHADGSVGHSYRCTGDSTSADRPLNRG